MKLFFKSMRRIDKSIDHLVRWVLVASLLTMLFLGMLGIVSRWFSWTLLWIGPVIQHFVLWIAFLGGALATSARQQLGIDLLTKYLADHLSVAAMAGVALLKDLVCLATLCWVLSACSEFIQNIYSYEKEGVLAGIPVYVWASVVPVGLALLALRFLFLVLFDLEAMLVQKGERNAIGH